MGITLTPEQQVLRIRKECERVLARAVKTARAGGLRVQEPEVFQNHEGKWFIQAICSDKFFDLLADEVHSSPLLTKVDGGDVDGWFDWPSETYIKPYGWIEVKS